MSLIDMNEIFVKWIEKKEEHKYSIQLGIYTEKKMKIIVLNQFWSLLINVYLLLYELQKIYKLISILILPGYTSEILNGLNYFVLEEYFEIKSIHLSIMVIIIPQFLCVIYLFIDFFCNWNRNINTSCFEKILFNMFNCFIILFPYTCSYINIIVLSKTSVQITSIYLYSLNLFNSISFSFTYCIYIHFLNDISPIDNRYFFSISNPKLYFLTLIKFTIYNLIIIFYKHNLLPSFVIIFIIFTYLTFNLYYIYRYIYIIHYLNFLCIYSKSIFILNVFLSYYIMMIIFNNSDPGIYSEIYYLIISICLSIIIFLVIVKYRKRMFQYYKIYDSFNYDFVLDEFHIYDIFSRNNLSISDVHKHFKMCNSKINDYICSCSGIYDRLDDEFLINKIKVRTCFLLSKLRKSCSLLTLVYIHCLLNEGKLNKAIFKLFSGFDASFIKSSRFHYIVRMTNEIIKQYNSIFQTKSSMLILNSSVLPLIDIKSIIIYEHAFNMLLKNIKKVFKIAHSFWLAIKLKQKNFYSFFSFGNEIAELTLTITHQFAEIYKINPNKGLLLNVYSCFVTSILNDDKYTHILNTQMKENIILADSNEYKNINPNQFNKELGVLVISGDFRSQFKILSYNYAAKIYLKLKHSIKNQDIHCLQPFPLNFIHRDYIMHNLKISIHSDDRNLFWLQENGNLVFTISKIIPCLSYDGKINFFMTFYNTEDNSSMNMSAIVDSNGKIFAATESFKQEFNCSLNISMNDNFQLFHKYKEYINKSNLFSTVDEFFKRYGRDKKTILPFIYDYFNELRNFKKESVSYKYRDDRNRSSSINLKIKNPHQIFEVTFDKIICQKQRTNSSPATLKIKRSINCVNAKNNESSENYPQYLNVNRYIKKIKKNDNYYDLQIIKKNVFSEKFPYFIYSFIKIKEIKKEILFSKLKSYKIEINPVKGINNDKINIENQEQKIKNLSTNNLSTNISRYDGTFSFNTLNKTEKLIYIYFTLSLFAFFIIFVINLVFNIIENLNYIENSNMLNEIVDIRFKFYYLFINAYSLLNIRLKVNSDKYSIFRDKTSYLKNSIDYDINFIEDFMTKLEHTDLSNNPYLKDKISTPSLNLSNLNDNYQIISNNYSLFRGINVYFSYLKSFVKNESFTIDYEDYLQTKEKLRKSIPSENEKIVVFLFSNYMNKIQLILEEMLHSVLSDGVYKLNIFNSHYYYLTMIELFTYLLIVVLVFHILIKIYQINTVVQSIYSKLEDKVIDLSLNHFDSAFKQILNLRNDNKKILTMSNQNKHSFIKFSENDRSNTKLFNNEYNTTNIRDEKKHLELLNTVNFKSRGNQEIVFKLKDDDNKRIIQSSSYYYVSYFIKVNLVFTTFIYIIIFQILIRPIIYRDLLNLFYNKLNLTNSTSQIENCVIDLAEYFIIPNPNVDVNSIKCANKDMLTQYQREINFLANEDHLYSSSIKQKISNYNLDFCLYFYKATSLYKLLNPGTTYEDCQSTIMSQGVQFFIFNFKNDLIKIYSLYISESNKTVKFLLNLMDQELFKFTTIAYGYYLRGFYSDLLMSIESSYDSVITLFCTIYIFIIIVFILQFILYLYLAFYIYNTKLHIYFQKMRILLSIIPKDINKINNKIEEFLGRFY